MSGSASPTHGVALHALAQQLGPALCEACDARLGEIRWFQSDWQRGGAATGYGEFWVDPQNGRPSELREVVVKLPVGPVEHRFTTGLAVTDAPTPRVVAHGSEVGGYDLAWLVMERLPGDPLSLDKSEGVFAELAAAAAAFHLHAAAIMPAGAPKDRPDWDALLAKSRESLRVNEVPDGQKWKEAVKHVQKALPRLVAKWESRPISGWCHGDLHPGNAMRRPEGSPWGPPCCVLLDLAEVHPGNWVEDAVYLERLYWGRPDALHGMKPLKLLAQARRAIGLDNGETYPDLANVRRVLMAACAPAFLHREGNARYMAAALDIVERLLAQAAA